MVALTVDSLSLHMIRKLLYGTTASSSINNMVKPSPSTSYMTVHDLLQLSRPGQGLVSPQADRALWSDSQFDFKAAEGKGRTTKTLYIIDTLSDRTTPRTLLSNLAFTEAAWLDNDTILYLRPALPANVLQEHYIDNQGHRQDHPVHLSNEAYAKQRKQHAQLDGGNAVELWAKDVNEASDEDYLVARLPVELVTLQSPRVPVPMRDPCSTRFPCPGLPISR